MGWGNGLEGNSPKFASGWGFNNPSAQIPAKNKQTGKTDTIAGDLAIAETPHSNTTSPNAKGRIEQFGVQATAEALHPTHVPGFENQQEARLVAAEDREEAKADSHHLDDETIEAIVKENPNV